MHLGGGAALATGASGGGGGLGDVRLQLPGQVQTRGGKQVQMCCPAYFRNDESTAVLMRAIMELYEVDVYVGVLYTAVLDRAKVEWLTRGRVVL